MFAVFAQQNHTIIQLHAYVSYIVTADCWTVC